MTAPRPHAFTLGAIAFLALGVALASLASHPAAATQVCAPTGVTATPLGMVVQLAWDDVAGASSYNIYRADGDANATLAIQQAAPSNGTIDTQVESGHTYTYSIRAVVQGVELDACSEAVVTAGGDCSPMLGVVAAEGTNQLQWTQLPAASGYLLERAAGAGAYETIATLDASTSSYADSDIEGGVVYHYQLHAVVGDETRPACNTIEATAIPEFPTAVAITVAAALGAGAYFVARKQ